MLFYINLFLLSCAANVIPAHDPNNVPNLFNLPGMLANNRTDIQLIEGDIAIPVTSGRTAFIQAPKWTNNIVPIVIDGPFSNDQKNIINSAMATISRITNDCIKFVYRTNQPAWIRIFSGQG